MHDCHSGYISFYGVFLSDPNICICMEFMDKGFLDGIYKQGPIDIKVVAKVAHAMLKGLTYLFDAHRNIHCGAFIASSFHGSVIERVSSSKYQAIQYIVQFKGPNQNKSIC